MPLVCIALSQWNMQAQADSAEHPRTSVLLLSSHSTTVASRTKVSSLYLSSEKKPWCEHRAAWGWPGQCESPGRERASSTSDGSRSRHGCFNFPWSVHAVIIKHYNGTRAGVGLAAWVNGHVVVSSHSQVPHSQLHSAVQMCPTAELGHSSIMRSPVCLPSAGERKLTPKPFSSLC